LWMPWWRESRVYVLRQQRERHERPLTFRRRVYQLRLRHRECRSLGGTDRLVKVNAGVVGLAAGRRYGINRASAHHSQQTSRASYMRSYRYQHQSWLPVGPIHTSVKGDGVDDEDGRGFATKSCCSNASRSRRTSTTFDTVPLDLLSSCPISNLDHLCWPATES